MDLNKNNIKKIILIIMSCILFYMILQKLDVVIGVCSRALGIVFPFILGLCVAFILNVPMRAVEKHLFGHYSGKRQNIVRKIKRPVSYIITLLLVLGVIFIVVFLVAPQLGATFKSIYQQVPVFFNEVQKWGNRMIERYSALGGIIADMNFHIDWATIGTKVMTFLQSFASDAFSSTMGIAVSIVNGVVTFVVGFIFSIYVLFQKEMLSANIKKLMYAWIPEKRADQIIDIAALSDKVFSKFLSGQCLEAVIIGCMFFVVMTICRMPYALLISVVIAFCALIPVVGAFIGCIVGALLILIQNPLQAVGFVIMFLVIQQVEGNLIYPKVVGNSVGLPSIWVLVAVTVGGNVMGVAGMLIFIPLVSVIYTLLRDVVYARLKERDIAAEKISVKKNTEFTDSSQTRKLARQQKRKKKKQN